MTVLNTNVSGRNLSLVKKVESVKMYLGRKYQRINLYVMGKNHRTLSWLSCTSLDAASLYSLNRVGWNNQFHFHFVDNLCIGHAVTQFSLFCFLCFFFLLFFISGKRLYDMYHMVNTMIVSLMFLWLCFVLLQKEKRSDRNLVKKTTKTEIKTFSKPPENVVKTLI